MLSRMALGFGLITMIAGIGSWYVWVTRGHSVYAALCGFTIGLMVFWTYAYLTEKDNEN